MAWSSNSIGTEAPYLLFFTMVLYYTFLLGIQFNTKNTILYVLSFLLAFMFRANILIMIIATPAYLIYVKKCPINTLKKWFLLLIASMLVFIVPWTIRNYINFNAFIPISYGGGNPMLLGTYNGNGSLPADDEKTKAAADELFYLEYKDYFNDDGSIKDPRHESFLILSHDNVEARVRIREWINRDLSSFLKYYLLVKPRLMLNWVWYWDSVFGIPYNTLHLISIINMLLCACGLFCSVIVKILHKEMIFLSSLYIFSIYSCAVAFVSDRYSSLFMPIRYIMAGLALYTTITLITKLFSNICRFQRR